MGGGGKGKWNSKFFLWEETFFFIFAIKLDPKVNGTKIVSTKKRQEKRIK